MSTDKKWKDHLLASGLPLEQAAATTIRKKNYLVKFEYPFLRYNERSEAGHFSIDLRAVKRLEDQNFSAVLMVECKFRRTGTEWIFVPNEDDPPFDLCPPPIELHNMYSTSYLVSPIKSETFTQRDYSYRGVELKSGSGDNPASLTTALNQIKYAFLESSIEHAKSNLNDITLSATPPRFPFAVTNIIVTTANLRMLKIGQTMSDYYSAEEIDSVSDVRDYIILHNFPDPYFQSYSRRRINETLSDSALEAEGLLLGRELAAKTSAMHSLKSFQIWHSKLKPAVYCIVNFHFLENFLDLLDKERTSLSISSPEMAQRIWKVNS